MAKLYAMLTLVLEPFLWLWLKLRLSRGKEDSARFRERFGYASIARPKAKLLWIHAASVGESLSVLPLIERLTVRYPEWHVLLTTVTVTSARLVESRLPLRAVHQFLPIDGLRPVRRFLKHWKPDVALWVESELWPNLMLETKAFGCPMLLVNGRISERSFRQWRRYRKLAQTLLPCFICILAQTERIAQRFQKLGARNVGYVGNLKYDAPPLPCPLPELEVLTRAVGGRKVWLAASTHPGEEELIFAAHQQLKQKLPNLLTVVAPRHQTEGERLRKLATAKPYAFAVAQRSRNEIISPETELYIADTLGELGLFFTLASVVCMGGSLNPTGGHNPLEPARLDCAILTGPYVHHFTEVYEELDAQQGVWRVAAEADALAQAVATLLTDAARREALIAGARKAVHAHEGVLQRVLDVLDPYLASVR